MQFQVLTRKTYHGYDAYLPTLRECETWACTEDEALKNLLERVAFFLNLPPGFVHALDVSRKEEGMTVYTLTVR